MLSIFFLNSVPHHKVEFNDLITEFKQVSPLVYCRLKIRKKMIPFYAIHALITEKTGMCIIDKIFSIYLLMEVKKEGCHWLGIKALVAE